MTLRYRDQQRKWAAFVLTVFLLAPLFVLATPSANAQLFGKKPASPQKPGMSTGKKVLLLGGAALLYYLYRKHQANVAAKNTAQGTVAGNPRNTGNNARTPQLYRSKNGGVYYRDPQGKPVWLTVPQQGLQVPVQDVQRYAPDYSQYSGPAPAAPQGYRTQQFNQFDNNAYGGTMAPTGSGNPPGPRGRY